MVRGKASGYTLSNSDASIVLAMVNRGDRDHDIAAWFGVNQGRIAEVKDGKFGNAVIATGAKLPPKGPPGVKGKKLRSSVARALTALNGGDSAEAQKLLEDGADKYDAHEA